MVQHAAARRCLPPIPATLFERAPVSHAAGHARTAPREPHAGVTQRHKDHPVETLPSVVRCLGQSRGRNNSDQNSIDLANHTPDGAPVDIRELVGLRLLTIQGGRERE